MSALLSARLGGRIQALEAILAGALFLLGALAVLVPANPAVHGLDRDSGFYTYIGNEILHGKLPYRDAWESKPPAVFYLNALGLWLGHGSRWGIWALEFIFLLVATYLGFCIMRGLWGGVPAVFGVLLLLYGFERTFENGNFTEEYPLPLHFASIGLLTWLSSRPQQRAANFLMGLLLAVCLLFRPNNAVPEVAAILTLAIIRILAKDYLVLLKQLLWIALGTILPLAITGLYFWSQGLLQDLLNASILYNLTYSGTEITASTPFEVGWRAFGVLFVLLAALGYVIAAARLKVSTQKSASIFLLIGLPLAIVLSDPARRTYLHYYMNWLPFLAMLGSLALHAVLSKWLPAALVSGAAAPTALAVGVGAALVFFAWAGRATDMQRTASMFLNRQQTGIEYVPALAVYVQKHTGPDDTVLFWGAYPGMNFLSKRESASGVLFYPLFVTSPISSDLESRFVEELVRNKPALIVDMNDPAALSLDPVERQQQLAEGLGWPYMPGNIGQVWGFLAQNYAPSTKVSGHEIYALKSGS